MKVSLCKEPSEGMRINDVAFEPVGGSINDRIDDAYRAKYHDGPLSSSDAGCTRPCCDRQSDAKPRVNPIPEQTN